MFQPKGNPGQRKSMSLNDPRSGEHNPDLKSRLSRFSRFFRGKGVKKEKIDPELEVNQRVVTFIEDDVSRGTIRHIGEEKDSNGIVQKILGLEMDKMISIGGCGRRNGRRLFSCEEGFSLFIPVESVMLEREFDAEPEALETPEEEEEESSEEFDSQSDDDSSEMGIDKVSVERKLEVEQDHCTPSNPQEEEYREWKEYWKMQSTTLQEGMTNCKVESDHVWDETVTLYGQLVEQSITVSSESLAQGLTGSGTDLDEETKHQNNEVLELQVKEEQLVKEEQEAVPSKALQDGEKQQNNALGQTKNAEEDLKISQDDFSITAVRLHEAEEEEERRVENLSTDLSETEQRLRKELIRTEIRVVLLNNQLMIKQQQVKNFQRKVETMEQQLTVREHQKETFRTQRDKEQRLLEELNEKETTEILLRKQLRGKDCLEVSLRRQLSEKGQQLEEKDKGDETLREEFREMEGRLREEITEKDARQVVLCEQFKEKDQQLKEMKQQLTATEEREEDLKTQIRNVEEQLRKNEDRVENLRTNLRDAEQRLTQNEAQEENLRSILKLTEERMREELAEKETRETELCEQLRENEKRTLDLQRRLSEMEQQLSEKNDEKQTLLRQLTEMEQRSREETAEIEMKEIGFHEQLRERELEMREIRQQLTEKEQQEENLRTQLRVHLM
ncbi:trichohyalin-like [Stylophora pistillata]|uniref:trichohyalin-like n=1 Tax=Stylophora pistillata TaxID=50429 RepID=UPI000C039E1D|nr:trichohyalin-like [Stylophora pistillata]